MGFTDDLRTVVTGPTLRSIIGLPQSQSDVKLAKMNGGATTASIASDNSDVYVNFTETISGWPGIARLYAPHNILWRLPPNKEELLVLKPSFADGPGVPWALYGNGSKGQAQVPSWLDTNNCGLNAPETVHIESINAGVVLRSNSTNSSASSFLKLNTDGSISLNGGVGGTVQIASNGGAPLKFNGGGHPLPLWDTFETALTTWVTAMQTMINALVVPTGIALPAQTAAATACATMLALLAGATFNSQTVQNA